MQDCIFLDANEPLLISTTSGTASRPKFIQHSHLNPLFIGAYHDKMRGLSREETIFSFSTQGWMLAFICSTYGNLVRGGASIIYEGSINNLKDLD